LQQRGRDEPVTSSRRKKRKGKWSGAAAPDEGRKRGGSSSPGRRLRKREAPRLFQEGKKFTLQGAESERTSKEPRMNSHTKGKKKGLLGLRHEAKMAPGRRGPEGKGGMVVDRAV